MKRQSLLALTATALVLIANIGCDSDATGDDSKPDAQPTAAICLDCVELYPAGQPWNSCDAPQTDCGSFVRGYNGPEDTFLPSMYCESSESTGEECVSLADQNADVLACAFEAFASGAPARVGREYADAIGQYSDERVFVLAGDGTLLDQTKHCADLSVSWEDWTVRAVPDIEGCRGEQDPAAQWACLEKTVAAAETVDTCAVAGWYEDHT